MLKHGFQRASADVLSKRRILKVKRPAAATSEPANTTSSATNGNPFASASLNAASNGSTANEDSKEKESKPSTNPFASTSLKASSSASDATSKPKVFGSGASFSGFKTAVSKSGSGFGATGTKTGGFGGFGNSSSSSTSGFGGAPPQPAEIGFASGGASSLFQAAAAGSGNKFSFGFAKGSEPKDNTADEKSEDDTNKGVNDISVPAVKLPEHVELTTGEEDEDVIHEARCKSFHWVPKDQDNDGLGTIASASVVVTKANPSVKPSTEFQAAISSSKGENEEKTEKKNGESAGKEDDEKDGDSNSKSAKPEGDKKEDPSSSDKKDSSSKSTLAEAASAEKFRWQELGVGPIKILSSLSKNGKYRMVQRRESTKNGPATKVILNVPLWKESTGERTAPKFLTLKTVVDGKVESYSLRFKDSSDASYFHHYLSEAIPKCKSAFAATD